MTGVAAGVRVGSEQSGGGDRAARPRRAVGAGHSAAPAAQAPPAALSGPPAHRRSRRAGRDCVRAQDRHHLEPAPHGAGRLLRGDLLAAPAGTGPRPAFGRPRTHSCSTSCAPSASWTWTGVRSTARTSAPSQGDHVGPSPVDRGRPGSKHHLIVEAGGIPLAVSLTGGNHNDVTQLIRWSRRSRRSASGAAGPAGDRVSCSPTTATTTTSTAASCAPGAHPAHRPPRSRPRLGARPQPLSGRARFHLPARLRAAVPPGMSAAPTSTSAYSSWPAPSSATAGFRSFWNKLLRACLTWRASCSRSAWRPG